MARIVAGLACAFAGIVLGSPSANASETTTYTYDSLGRLVAVEKAGDVNDGQEAATTYDAAGNRTNHTVTGATPTSANIAIADASITEGGVLSFAVTRSGITTSAVSVDYAITDVSTSAGDYSGSTSGTVSFVADDTAETVTLQTSDDSSLEGVETLQVTLSNPSTGATISDGTATGTINDNEVGISIADASGLEGDTLGFVVTLSAPAPGTVTVDYATSDGTATSASDYTAASNTLTYTTGQSSKTINIATTEDTNQESTETFSLTLSNPTGGGVITDGSATGTITDDDSGLPVVSVSDAGITEGGQVEFTITMTPSSSDVVKVWYTTSDGTAVDPDDYDGKNRDIRFHNDTSKTFNIRSEQDSLVEGNETFNVTITIDSGDIGEAVIGDGTGVGTIIDDD